MKTLADILIAFVALEHFGFMVLEMFFWTTPFGLKTFKQTPQQAQDSRVLAANQGLYNGFLAAGLVWPMLSSNDSVKVFFLACVLVAGIFGGLTSKRTILYVQALPALLALIALFLSR